MRIRQNPLWLWNPEETSPEIPNRDPKPGGDITRNSEQEPQIGHVNVSAKKLLNEKKLVTVF